MSFDFALTSALLRYQGVAEELLAAAQNTKTDPGAGMRPLMIGVQDRLAALIDEVVAALREGGQDELASELHRLIPRDNISAHTYDIQAAVAALVGWLRGLVQGQQYEARLQAEATAYAKERVRAERGVGFIPPGA